MTLSANRTVGLKVYSAGTADDWGNASPSWADAVDRAVYGWGPATPTEEHDAARNPVEIDMRVWAPESSLGDVTSRDRLVINGDLFDVVGSVENYNFGPFDYAPGVRVNCKRVEG